MEESDNIQAELQQRGWNMRDSRYGYELFPSHIVVLAEQRWAARREKNFAESDRLRDALAAGGYTVRDRKDGYDLVRTAGGA